MFNGFENVAAYRRECNRLGYRTEIQKYVKDTKTYDLLLTSYKSGIPSWHLFDENEREILEDCAHHFDYKTQLAGLGYFLKGE